MLHRLCKESAQVWLLSTWLAPSDIFEIPWSVRQGTLCPACTVFLRTGAVCQDRGTCLAKCSVVQVTRRHSFCSCSHVTHADAAALLLAGLCCDPGAHHSEKRQCRNFKQKPNALLQVNQHERTMSGKSNGACTRRGPLRNKRTLNGWCFPLGVGL